MPLKYWLKSGDPARRARAIVEATTHYNEPEILAEISKGLGEAMVGISVSSLSQDKLMAGRGW
jgi:pyridoxal 5'-phosphate synthase pdxS subunit